MTGGVAMNVGFGGSKVSSGKAPSKDLVDRLSKKPLRIPKKMEKSELNESQASRAADGTRNAMKVNPVTGKMTVVDPKSTVGKVREGCMMIDEKYLRAAAAAGLGGANGMYTHMSGVKKTLSGGHNIGSTGNKASSKSDYTPTVNNVGGRIHKIDTTKNNVKHVVQGRSRSINSGGGSTHESHYSKQKGVISHMGGCSSIKSREDSNSNKERKTGIASLGSSGGRSYVKVEKKELKKVPVKADYEMYPQKPVRESITKKLGGTEKSSSSGGVDMSDREKRAAYFAQRFGK